MSRPLRSIARLNTLRELPCAVNGPPGGAGQQAHPNLRAAGRRGRGARWPRTAELRGRGVLAGVILGEEVEQAADLLFLFEGVAHGAFAVQGVAVASADAFAFDVAGLGEVGDDPLGCPFG